MYLLDTDHLTIIERGAEVFLRLRSRLAQVNASQVGTTIISYEEQMRGWLDKAARAGKIDDQVRIYAKLEQNLLLFAGMSMLSFDLAAATEFQRLRHVYRRLGTMDLKIAAIAMTGLNFCKGMIKI